MRLVRLKVQNYTDAQYLMFKEKVKEVRRKRQSSRWSGVSWFEGRWRGYGFKRKNGGRAYNRRFPTEMEAAVEYNKSLDDAVKERQLSQEKADEKYNLDDEGNKLM